MRQVIRLLSVLVVMMLSIVVAGSAQEASPPGEPMPPDSVEIAPGVTADQMIFAGGDAPVNYRLTFDAGVVYEVMPGGNLEVGYVESGSLVMVLDAAVTVGRVGDVESGGLEVPANTEFTVEAGQFIVLQPGVSGEIRNEGGEPAVVSVAGLTPAGVPGATPES